MRRQFGLELGLGLALVLVVGWLALGSEERGTKRASPRATEERGERAENGEPIGAPLALASALETPFESGPARLERRPGVVHPPSAAVGAAPSAGALEVLVLTAGGSPAVGVPVSLEVRTEPSSSGPVKAFSTDATGRVSIPLGSPASWKANARVVSFLLRTNLFLEDAPEIDLGPDAPLPQALTLRLPPAGSLRVRVLDAADEAVRKGASVYVRGDVGSVEPAQVREGWAEVPWIGLGKTLDVRAALDGMRGGDVSALVPGPTHEGETVETTLRMKAAWPEIAFRAVDERGKPLAQTALSLCLTQEPLSPQFVKLQTGADGRASFLHLGQHRPQFPRLLELSADETPQLCARIALDFELEQSSATDLGDVVLSENEAVLLASGSVRDERGLLEGASVQLEPLAGTGERRQTTTDAQGRFEFRELPRKHSFRLSARADEHLVGEGLEVEPGQEGVVLELTTGVVLAVRLVLDDAFSILLVHLRLVSENGDQRVAPALALAGATLVEPGRYRLEVVTREGFLLESLPDVTVGLGLPPDPPLNPLDLRGVTRYAEFRLVDGGGKPLSWRPFRIRARGEEGSGITDQDGKTQTVLPSRWSEVELIPQGCASLTVVVTEAPQELVCTPR